MPAKKSSRRPAPSGYTKKARSEARTRNSRPAPSGYTKKARREASMRHSYDVVNNSGTRRRETFIADSFTYGPKPNPSKNWRPNPYGVPGAGPGQYGYILGSPNTRKPRRAR